MSPDKEKLPEEGYELNIKGKLILGFGGFIAAIIIMLADGVEGIGMKWFWIVIMILILGFDAFLHWKFLRHTKQHIVTLISLALGVGLVSLLF